MVVGVEVDEEKSDERRRRKSDGGKVRESGKENRGDGFRPIGRENLYSALAHFENDTFKSILQGVAVISTSPSGS